MTVPSDAAQPPRATYVEDGITTVHAIPFTFENASEITVSRIVDDAEILLVNPTHYTVAGGAGDVGSITKVNGGVVGAELRIDRNTVRDQLVHREPGDDFPVEEQEATLDKMIRITQELARDLLSREDVRDLIGALLVAGAGIVITSTTRRRFADDREHDRRRNISATPWPLTWSPAPGSASLTTTCSARSRSRPTGSRPCPIASSSPATRKPTTAPAPAPSALTGEQIQDLVATMFVNGAGINVVYNDATGEITITNTIGAGYTDENRCATSWARAWSRRSRISISVNDAGDTITIASDALAPSYRGLAVVPKAGAFALDDTHSGKSILYTGGAAAATLANEATTALSDGWGTLIRNKGSGTLTLNLGGAVSMMVNGAIVAAASVAIAVGGVCSLNRWGADDFTAVGPKVTGA
jgi:hypothetical protein